MLNFPSIHFTAIVFTFAICSYTDNTQEEEEEHQQPHEQQELEQQTAGAATDVSLLPH